MQKSEGFDPSERIAGFSLTDIKHALGFVGFSKQNDVGVVADALQISMAQALRVVNELERRDYVKKLAAPGKLETTPKGRELAYFWSPPPKYTPVIWNETDDAEDGPSNEVFGDAECAILRSVDDDDVFEIARIEAGTFVDHADDRYVEIGVSIPDNEREESSAKIEVTTYLSIGSAKQFAGLLQQAIEAAEREHERRADEKSGRRKKRKTRSTNAPSLALKHDEGFDERHKNANTPWDKTVKWTPSVIDAVGATPSSKRPPELTAGDRKRRSALTATLREARTGKT